MSWVFKVSYELKQIDFLNQNAFTTAAVLKQNPVFVLIVKIPKGKIKLWLRSKCNLQPIRRMTHRFTENETMKQFRFFYLFCLSSTFCLDGFSINIRIVNEQSMTSS